MTVLLQIVFLVERGMRRLRIPLLHRDQPEYAGKPPKSVILRNISTIFNGIEQCFKAPDRLVQDDRLDGGPAANGIYAQFP